MAACDARLSRTPRTKTSAIHRASPITRKSVAHTENSWNSLSVVGAQFMFLSAAAVFFASQARRESRRLIYEWGRSPIGDKFVSGNFNTTHTLTLADAIIHKLDLLRPRKPPPPPPPSCIHSALAGWLADSLLFIFLYYLGCWFTRAVLWVHAPLVTYGPINSTATAAAAKAASTAPLSQTTLPSYVCVFVLWPHSAHCFSLGKRK